MVGVVPDTVNLTHAFALPRIALVAVVLLPAPSVSVSITSVPAMMFFQRKTATLINADSDIAFVEVVTDPITQLPAK